MTGVPTVVLPEATVALVEALHDGVVAADRDGTVIYANDAVSRLLGWSRDDLVGQSIVALVPERLRATHLAGFQRFMQTGVGQIMGRPVRVPAVTANGDERTIELLLSELPLRSGGRYAVATLRDVEDRVMPDVARREREIAEALQRNLLPSRIPDIDGLEIAAVFRPGGELVVGGDFYDVFTMPDGPDGECRWGVAIGDVCGTGPDAASMTALVRHKARALLRVGIGVADALRHINTAMLDREDHDHRFCTCQYAVLECVDERTTLHLVGAGHPYPLVRRRHGSVELCALPGALLGVLPEPPLDEVTVDLAPGESIVLYTDGATEARRGSEFYGTARLVERVSRLDPSSSAQDIAGAIDADVSAFVDGSARDDLAVLVVRRPA